MANGSKPPAFWLRLVDLAADAGLSLNKLAARADVTTQSMQKWKHGTSRPTYETRKRLAEALRLPISALLDDPSELEQSVYPSLEAWTSTRADLTDAELAYLRSVRFPGGEDVGSPDYWSVLLSSLRGQIAQLRGAARGTSTVTGTLSGTNGPKKRH